MQIIFQSKTENIDIFFSANSGCIIDSGGPNTQCTIYYTKVTKLPEGTPYMIFKGSFVINNYIFYDDHFLFRVTQKEEDNDLKYVLFKVITEEEKPKQ